MSGCVSVFPGILSRSVGEAYRLMDLLRTSASWLEGRGVENARRECEWIFSHRLRLDRLGLYTHFDMPLDEGQIDLLREDLRRRGRREPLAYVLGTQPFRGLELVVSPAVLVPRPETEELVALALASIEGKGDPRILDVGTGSGAIALACKRERDDAAVAAADVSRDALAVARRNAARLDLHVGFVCADCATAFAGGWDLVCANLPYVAAAERGLCDPECAWEPEVALFAGDDDGLATVRALLADCSRLLAADGVAWFEIGFRQADAALRAAVGEGLAASSHRDAAGLVRFLEVRR